ncbi:transporter substrate-binding protein [Intrasporangium oryzae NRRL B-24470]|uniref:Transporter substrate-binding protein n=1 Tax=Intrasporangium oryzae NRRL B-24470 TaxID=1386089 RepID=W9GBR0_9MICO|nr:glutamate ABC transporter substrate-binding protein [Intrasporangium oryzae]EWT03641.1 transporter substrate-binding protein [Intrasporangium oryzae NRRL B-24470]
MTTQRRTPRGRIVALLAGTAVATLAACTGVTYADTPLPATPAPTPTPSAPAATPVVCSNATQSYSPLASIPSSGSITDPSVRAILRRGYLVVGASADTYLFGARDPFTGQISGFDIDIAKAVAKSLFGDENKIQLRVITAADRIPVLTGKDATGKEVPRVDMVVRNMSMTCDRWKQIAFSAEYYRSGQKVLVAKGTPNAASVTLSDLKGKRVCAPTGTSSLDKLRTVQGPIPVTAANHTGCLVLFQQGKADAITGDDTVLAGLAAQDPYTVVSKAPAITVEPYGVGLNKDDVYLARYINTLLAEMKADGRWKQIYNRWLAGPLGPAPAPPTPVYGR